MGMDSTSYIKLIEGLWLQRQAGQALPEIYGNFEFARDPAIAAQRRDLQKTEAQRREENGDSGRAHTRKPVKTDKPTPALKPPPHMRGGAGGEQWLTRQHSAAMAKGTVPTSPDNTPQQSQPRGTGRSGPTQSR